MKRSYILAILVIAVTGTLAAVSTFRGLRTSANDSAVLAPISLTVDVSDRKLHVIRGGDVVRSYPVTVGKQSHPTPKGSFTVRRIIWNPRWVPPDSEWASGERPREPGDPRNPMGKVKMFFREPDYYIHGTRDVDSLGGAASHGCIRMANADIISLARLAMENGGAPRSPNWFRRILNRVRSTEEVRLSNPVVLRIRA